MLRFPEIRRPPRHASHEILAQSADTKHTWQLEILAALAGDTENYNHVTVARGWESKSVEAQQAEASDKSAKPRPPMTADEAALSREKENLRLCRQRVLQQLEVSQNPRHRKQLEDSLADLDAKLKKLMA